MEHVHVAVIDCMLPGRNGVDLAVEIRKVMTSEDAIFFITGIYKDKSFASEAIKKTQAEKFFYKPFDIQLLISAIKKSVIKSQEESRLIIPSLLYQVNISAASLTEAIENTDSMSGMDLSFIIPALMLSKSTGHLNIASDEKKVSIDFMEGKIREVDSESAFQVMGQLLIKQGLLTKNEYDEIIEQTERSQFIDSLIADSWVSPHAMVALKKEQFFLELETLIIPDLMKISFVPHEIEDPSPCDIDYPSIQNLFHEMVELQIENIDWLRDFYSYYMNCAVVLKPEVGANHPILKHSVAKKIENFFDILSKSPYLSEIVGSSGIPEDIFYKGLHALTINQLIVFIKEKSRKAEAKWNGERTSSRLKILLENIKDLNPIEIFQYLGASEKVLESEAKEIFASFSRANHPDKLSKNATDELKELNQKIFIIISQAYEIVTDKVKRKRCSSSLKQKQAELKIKSQELVERGVIHLRQGRFKQAIEDLNTAYEQYKNPQTLLYIHWAELRLFNGGGLNLNRLKQINDSLMALPSEYRKSAVYHLVCGLVHREDDNYVEAGQSLRKSLKINPRFLDAKRELMDLLKAGKKRNQNIFTSDLSTVVSGFFKKKG